MKYFSLFCFAAAVIAALLGLYAWAWAFAVPGAGAWILLSIVNRKAILPVYKGYPFRVSKNGYRIYTDAEFYGFLKGVLVFEGGMRVYFTYRGKPDVSRRAAIYILDRHNEQVYP